MIEDWALLAAPDRYAATLRNAEFLHAHTRGRDWPTGEAGNRYVGHLGYTPVYLGTGLVRAGEAKLVPLQHLTYAIRRVDDPTPEVDPVHYWLRQIERMGWSVRQEWADFQWGMVAFNPARTRYVAAAVPVLDGRPDSRHHGTSAKRLALGVWREWAPQFLGLRT